MKRKSYEKYPNLFKCYPLFFWKKCISCGNEFRREHGYRAIIGPYAGGVGRNAYLCESCAPNEREAHDYFLNHRYVFGRPNTSPKGQSK